MTVLYRKARYLFSTYYYKITLERNIACVESLCVPLLRRENCFELKQYSRNISTQKNDFEQEVYNPSKKITQEEYQRSFDKAYRGNLRIKLNGNTIETPTLIAQIIKPGVQSGKN
jgi:hypothetical protein